MLDLALDISIVASLKSKYVRAVCGETRVSGRVRISEEDQKHGKPAPRSQLPVCSNCGLLLWSMAFSCYYANQEIDKGKVSLDEAKTTAGPCTSTSSGAMGES